MPVMLPALDLAVAGVLFSLQKPPADSQRRDLNLLNCVPLQNLCKLAPLNPRCPELRLSVAGDARDTGATLIKFGSAYLCLAILSCS